ncbi:MAG: insulinase family protein [Acidobacteriota bacterium]|nr:insulinase family protein [Acidobacteriota bacterium]
MTLTRLLIAASLLSMSPQAPAPAPAPPRTPLPPRITSPNVALTVPFTQFTLPNGLHVILHEDHTVPLATVNVWYHVGSAREKPGRTGFAHLFEHLMFEGSAHVKEGEFDTLLEAAGATNNGSTETDRTNYYIDLPSNALELALFLESDRMGYLLDAMSPERVNGQRDVVKNERRQSYENEPYGMASIEIDKMLYPEGHPYRWPTIGYMEDLTAASYEDVVEFFRKYYQPGNASLVIAGDIDPVKTRALVEKWFSDVKPGTTAVPPIDYPHAMLTGVTRKTIEDRVQLPRLYISWLTPSLFKPGDAELDVVSQVLAGGKNSRLYKRLVYDLQIAQDVSAFQASAALDSQFQIVVTARPPGANTTPTALIDRIRTIVDEEIARLQQSPPAAREFQRAINQIEASFYNRMENVGGFSGKGNQLNAYYTATGDPDYFNEDLSRYRSLSASDIQAAAAFWLPANRRVELTVEPAKSTKPIEPGKNNQ